MSRNGPFAVLKRPALGSMVKSVELGLLLVCSFILTGAPIDFLVTTAGIAPTEGLGIFWMPLLASAVIGLLFRPMAILKSMIIAWPVLILFGSIAITNLWSFDPGSTMKNTIFLAASIAACFYFARHFKLRELLNVFALLFAILAFLSIGLALGLPQVGVMQDIHSGAWSGPWIDKNTLGRFFVLGASIALARLAENPKSWIGSLPLFAVSAGLVVMSTSKTALVALILVVLCVLAIFVIRRGPVIAAAMLWFGTLFLAGFMAVMAFSPDIVFGLLQRDATLTSRTKIWAATERLIEQQPVKGYGFTAVWTDKSASAPVVAVHQELQFEPVNAHSSWVDARLETGYFGVLALMFLVGFGFFVSILSIPWSKSAYWSLPTLVALLQTSFVESVLVSPHATESFLLILLVTIAASVKRPTRRVSAFNVPAQRTPALDTGWSQPTLGYGQALSRNLAAITHPKQM